MENNEITLCGTVEEEAVYSHNVRDEAFYVFKLRVPRLSVTDDVLPVTLSEKLLSESDIKVGKRICVHGQLRTYNKPSETRPKLILTVFARYITGEQETENPNDVILNGYICKNPTYRKTPFGREITDLCLAVNRAFGRSDYIPAIAWGKNALRTKDMEVGTNIIVRGRLQSREYSKRLGENEFETRVAYEVSITDVENIS